MTEKYKNLPLWIGMAAAVLIIIFGIFNIVNSAGKYDKGDSEYEKVREMAVSVNTVEDDSKTAEENEIMPPITVDLAALKNQNPDTVGWIYYPAANINYPVMQGADNDYYLTHTYQGENDIFGSIFMDMNASCDFTDDHTLVYGHNTKNGSMFGALKNIRENNMAGENPYIWLILENGSFRYQIFSWHDAKTTDDSFKTYFDTTQEKQAFIDHITELAEEKLDVKVGADDKILTLSTCTSDSSVRFIVHGVLID